MSKVYGTADLHWGHPNVRAVPGRREHFGHMTMVEHDEILLDNINSTVLKRDTLYVLGDIGFDAKGYITAGIIPRIVCRNVHVVAGNHDSANLSRALGGQHVHGAKQKTFRGVSCLLSHIPIHPQEMFWDLNIHGHLHNNTVKTYAYTAVQGQMPGQMDPRYICISVERAGFYPVNLHDLVEQHWRLNGERIESAYPRPGRRR